MLAAALVMAAPAAGPAVVVDAEAEWRVGLAAVCITPDEPVWLHGYKTKTRFRPFEGVLDDVYAKAVAIQSGGGEPAVLIAADLCVLREPEEKALCEVIMRKTRRFGL